CVKHAASVRPEPGSNSPLKNNTTHNPKAMRGREDTRQETLTKKLARINCQRNHPLHHKTQKTGHKQTNSSTI
ncbi:hypothetical protein AB3X52_18450, partial [Nocardioides sp. DS6]